MTLDERGETVTGLVMVGRDVELFGELVHSSSAGGGCPHEFHVCADPVFRGSDVCATGPEWFDHPSNDLLTFDFVSIAHTQTYAIHMDKRCVTEYY